MTKLIVILLLHVFLGTSFISATKHPSLDVLVSTNEEGKQQHKPDDDGGGTTTTAAASGQSSYLRKLLSAAKPTANSKLRVTLQNDQEDFDIRLARYSMKFSKCYTVETFDYDIENINEVSGGEQNSTSNRTSNSTSSSSVVGSSVGIKQYVIFRLCPTRNGCNMCEENYGEYLIDLDHYLQATVEYFQFQQEQYCNACNKKCGVGVDQCGQITVPDCCTCVDECSKIANMEDNGYLDATTFISCQLIYLPEDETDALYAGPVCASNGDKISIGVFGKDCMNPYPEKSVEDYIVNDNGVQLKLSHALLRQTYSETCVSCKEPARNKYMQGDDIEDSDKVLDMCETLYNYAGKCETTHGFFRGFTANEEGYYEKEHLLAQEKMVCDFMEYLGYNNI